MADIVIDLETRDTTQTAKIVSIGAVKMHLDGHFESCIQDTFYLTLDWVSQPRTETVETIRWWTEQSMEVRSALRGVTSLWDGLNALSVFIEDDVVWGNGSTFDVSILQNCYEQHGLNIPWKFSKVGDYRTVKRLYKEIYGQIPLLDFKGTKHNAMDDAIHEALMLHKMWNGIGGK